MTWVLLALESVYLYLTYGEFALRLRVSIVKGPWRPVSRPFADG